MNTPLNIFTVDTDVSRALSTSVPQGLRTELYEDTNDNTEILFSVSTNPRLALDLHQRNGLAVEFLEHKVVREPSDLRSHVQRIYLYSRMKDGDGLYGALLDLFIALNSKGYFIRKRMLSHAEYLINNEQFNALNRKLEAGVLATDPMPLSGCSVLSRGLIGTDKFISVTSTEENIEPRHTDVVDEVEELLDSGQIDEARLMLENAILVQPWRKDLHDDLLEIYLVTRDIRNCDAMYEKLSDKFIPDHHAWSHTIERIHQFVGAA
jgi:hypothetical protein